MYAEFIVASIDTKNPMKQRELAEKSLYDENLSSRHCAHAQMKYKDNSTSARGARASYQTISPEILARGSLLWAKVQIPIVTDRQGGRDKSAPRPHETDPIHPLSSTHR